MSSEPMTTRARQPGRAALALIAALALAAVGLAPPLPAGAQSLTEQIERLESEMARLDERVAAAEREVEDVAAQVEELREALVRSTVELELLADEYGATVESRRAPERLRLVIGIDAYVRGDPRITSLLADLIRLESHTEDLVNRELYRSVVQMADDRLAAIDRQLRSLGEQARRMQRSTRSVRDDLDAAGRRHTAAVGERNELVAERAALARRLEDLRAQANRAVLTGIDGFQNPDRPALVVKIDNVRAARPQVGINQADVVFEELVEGGLSRLAAVYHSAPPLRVGPVRSVRSTDIGMLALLDRPLLASSGGNPGVRAELAASTLVDVGVTELPGLYQRDRSRRPPHNLFTHTGALWDAAGDRGGRPSSLFSYRRPGDSLPPSAIPITEVSINFGQTRVAYEWTGSGWARSQDGRAHTDAAGTRVAPPNVVIQFTTYRPSRPDARSPEAIVTGSGEAWILTGGHLVRAHWNRPEATDVTTYTDEDGDPVPLTPGVTWIALPPPGTATVR